MTPNKIVSILLEDVSSPEYTLRRIVDAATNAPSVNPAIEAWISRSPIADFARGFKQGRRFVRIKSLRLSQKQVEAIERLSQFHAAASSSLVQGFFHQCINGILYEAVFPEVLSGVPLTDWLLYEMSNNPEPERLFEAIYKPTHIVRQSLYNVDSYWPVRHVEGKA